MVSAFLSQRRRSQKSIRVMNITPQHIPDPQDVAFFDQAVELMKRVYILHGQLDPMALIEHIDPKTGEATPLYLTQAPLSSTEEKMKFVASIQLAGITTQRKRSVVVLESWSVVTDTPESPIGRAPSELQSLMRISYAVFCLKKKIERNSTRMKSQHD